jgi:hypothetical protein
MSRPSVIPDLIDALIAHAKALPTLANIIVTDAVDLSQSNETRLMVGVSDPDSVNPQSSAQADQVWPNAVPTGRDESGFITCAVSGSCGDDDPKIIRDEVFMVAGEVQTMLRTSIQQAVAGLMWTSYGSQTFEQWRTSRGIEALLVFHVNFKARI